MRSARQDLKHMPLEEAEKTNDVWKWAPSCTPVERLSDGQIRVVTLDVPTGRPSTYDCDFLVAETELVVHKP